MIDFVLMQLACFEEKYRSQVLSYTVYMNLDF